MQEDVEVGNIFSSIEDRCQFLSWKIILGPQVSPLRSWRKRRRRKALSSMFPPPRGLSQFRQDKHHISNMNLWHLSPSIPESMIWVDIISCDSWTETNCKLKNSTSTISSLSIYSGCEADLANFCNSGGHLYSHVYSYTLRLLGGDQVSISLCSYFGVKIRFSSI